MIESFAGALEAAGKEIAEKTPSFLEKLEASMEGAQPELGQGESGTTPSFLEQLEASLDVQHPEGANVADAATDIQKGLEAGTQDGGQTEKADGENKETEKNEQTRDTPANGEQSTDAGEKKGLTDEEKNIIKKETGWSDEIINSIGNMDQYKILKGAGLIEAEIGGRKCLIKENIDLDYTDEDGISNRERMTRGLAPLDSKAGKPIELHHLGQKTDSPLVELTNEEHRTGEYKDGKKNQSLWHDNTIETEVHGEGNTWDKQRADHWKSRTENSRE